MNLGESKICSVGNTVEALKVRDINELTKLVLVKKSVHFTIYRYFSLVEIAFGLIKRTL